MRHWILDRQNIIDTYPAGRNLILRIDGLSERRKGSSPKKAQDTQNKLVQTSTFPSSQRRGGAKREPDRAKPHAKREPDRAKPHAKREPDRAKPHAKREPDRAKPQLKFGETARPV